jgi:hypothetical protein
MKKYVSLLLVLMTIFTLYQLQRGNGRKLCAAGFGVQIHG